MCEVLSREPKVEGREPGTGGNFFATVHHLGLLAWIAVYCFAAPTLDSR